MCGLTFKRRLERAFSLVELAIVLAISGIVISGGLLAGTILLESNGLEDTITRIDEVDAKIKEFVEINGHLPCPASFSIVPGAANFGAALHNGTDCRSPDIAYYPAGPITPNSVFVGTVPTRALGLPNEMMADAFGNRFIYAITNSLSTAASFVATQSNFSDTHDGTVTVANRFGNIHTNMAYALISTGINGKSRGGFRLKSGLRSVTCTAYSPGSSPTLAADHENCDNDGVFMDTRYNPDADTGRFYDDIIRYNTKFTLKELTAMGNSQLCNESNLGLTRYDEGAERIQECVASPPSTATWRDQAVINTTDAAPTDCAPHQAGMVRRSRPLPSSTYDECNGTTGQWETIVLP